MAWALKIPTYDFKSSTSYLLFSSYYLRETTNRPRLPFYSRNDPSYALNLLMAAYSSTFT